MTNAATTEATPFRYVDSYGSRFHLESGAVRVTYHGRHEGFVNLVAGVGRDAAAGEFVRVGARQTRHFLTPEALGILVSTYSLDVSAE